MTDKMIGEVALVGAGPGDPELITLKGLDRIQRADVIVYDRLANKRLLQHARKGTELVYAGKEAASHTMRQEEINALLVSKAKEGKTVVRLKGGDPFVFGRGGEEAEALAAAGIPFEIVPGVSSAFAVPACAGIPVTHREYSSSVAVITGHEAAEKNHSSLQWDRIATSADTLVFLMGRENLSVIAERLMESGRPADTPVAVISQGATPRQRTVEGTLADIVELVSKEALEPPVVIVVGKVVSLRRQLRWFDTRKLFGKRVLVTRSKDQASELSRLLLQHGAEPVELPTVRIEETVSQAQIEKLISRLSDYDWVIFTSVNGVEILFRQLKNCRFDARHFKGVRIAAIGPTTAATLEKHGLLADYVPAEYVAEGIVSGLGKLGVCGKRILLARAEQGRPALAQGLRALGATVEEIALYRIMPAQNDDPILKRLLKEGKIDIVTFTSSSTVRNLVAMLNGRLSCLEKACVACIGPVTAATAVELGFRVHIVAKEHSIPGLVHALVSEFGREPYPA